MTPPRPEQPATNPLDEELHIVIRSPLRGEQLQDAVNEHGQLLFVREAAAAALPDVAVARLVNAAHRMAKHTSLMKGEDGGAFVYHMRKANEAEADVFAALTAFGVTMTENPPERLLAEIERARG